MLFSSTTFLYVFLPIVLLVYFTVPKKLKNAVLLAASMFFYFFGERTYIAIMLISSVTDWIWSLLIEHYRAKGKEKVTKWFLVGSLVINLGLLGFFKYADFFIGNINALFGASLPLTGVYTFQTLSYTIDVYRGRAKANKNLVSFATFVCLFPQLIAGPIVRYTDIAQELDSRKHTLEGFSNGIRRFSMGLGKKVILANAMGEMCKDLLASGSSSVLMYWIYGIAFALQIYLDFSAYSDMAIGLGSILGFKFPENFDYPFISKSITEFWRRWHMTLGTWFRDYIYFPLGGSRTTTLKWLRNILIVWFVTGFWHGAAWNFVIWGLYFGVLLVIEKILLGKVLDKCPAVLRHVYVLFTTIISFVIFSVESMKELPVFLGGLFGVGTAGLFDARTLYILDSFAVLFAICVIASTPIPKMIWKKISDTKTGEAVLTVLEPVAIVLVVVFSTALLIDGSFNPFLYFRFSEVEENEKNQINSECSSFLPSYSWFFGGACCA